MFAFLKNMFSRFDNRTWVRKYLEDASDTYDLEYRMRELDRKGIHWYY
jgi:hypothetical protein